MRGKSGGREAVFSAIPRAGRAFAKAAAEGQVEVAGRREMGPAWCGLGVGREWQEAEDDCLGLPWVCRVLEHFSLTALKLERLCFVSPAPLAWVFPVCRCYVSFISPEPLTLTQNRVPITFELIIDK